MGPIIGVMPLYDEDRDSIWLLRFCSTFYGKIFGKSFCEEKFN